MFFEMCKCKKCNSFLKPEIEETIEDYKKKFDERKILYPTEKPPEIFNYFIMKCENNECLYKTKMTHKEILTMISKKWSEIAWSYYLSEEKNKFNFQEHFTKYIMLKGLNKFITQEDLDHNDVLRDYVRYVEGKLTEDSDN